MINHLYLCTSIKPFRAKSGKDYFAVEGIGVDHEAHAVQTVSTVTPYAGISAGCMMWVSYRKSQDGSQWYTRVSPLNVPVAVPLELQYLADFLLSGGDAGG